MAQKDIGNKVPLHTLKKVEDVAAYYDEWALNNGFVSVVPVKFDLTNHEVIEKIKSWNL